ncbi:class I SAM-dependent methyltransferase [Baia soyae]|uniref:Methyltransferase family protein n=1 Tax=Baia soyae TaxID=1544746 RepID=A0A4R2RNL3_9BACL|nr:class I SAM-dependent methyltransferase [Baia soyae]TCP64279.1 methyltransferase family protein [Baia soyae]
MQRAEFERKKNEITQKYGDWTSYDIKLGDDLYTRENRQPIVKLKRMIQIVKDISNKEMNDLRILDLACLEGQYAIEFALHGAEVVGIEGREVNIQKAIFAKDVLSLPNITFIQDDVRNLSKKKYGSFDVVFCSGIFYHLNTPDVFHFLENIYDVCTGFVIFDTHVSMSPIEECTYRNKKYHGKYVREHEEGTSAEEKLMWLWTSLDNNMSFWFTQPSLYNLLSHIGFSSAYRCYNPTGAGIADDKDRITILAMKGKKAHVISSPITNNDSVEWLEHEI